MLLRLGLEPAIQTVRRIFSFKEPYEDTLISSIIKQVYFPLELLLAITTVCLLLETVVPNVILVNRVSRILLLLNLENKIDIKENFRNL